MGITERLQIVATHNEPLNKHVIWLKGNVFRRWDGDGWEIIGGGGSGTTNYNDLENKPSINGITLEGNVKLNLEGYTKDEIDNKFNNLNIPNIDLKEYAKKSEIPSIEGLASETFVTTKIAEAQLGGSEVDLSDYATKLELQESIKSISIPSLSGYATEMWVNNQGFIKDIPEEYAKKTDIPSLSGYATETFVQEKINEAQLGGDENGESIDLSIYATKEWVEDNYLSDIPTDYITEEELGNKGFALESDLSRYQESISDLDTIRQGASKGATALQSYTEQYRGTVTGVRVNNSIKNSVSGIVDIGNVVTGVKINNYTKNPSNGIVDLGTVITSHQDISGKQDTLVDGENIKTINGISILGEGNIEILSQSDNKIQIIEHGIEDIIFEMTPNTIHKWDVIDSLTLTFPSDEDGYTKQYKAVFTAASNSFTMALPSALRWVNDEVPTFEASMQYEISVEGGRVLWAKFGAELIDGNLVGA